MPTAPTSSFDTTQPVEPPTSARKRVLAGAETISRPRPAQAPIPPAPRPQTAVGPRAQGAPAAPDALPRWAKGVVIGGLLLAVAMPVSVLLSRSMLVQDALAQQSGSNAAMVCTSGEGRAVDGSSLTGWLFGGSYFHCGDWETREARQQRERDQYEANYLAKERAKQGLN